MPDVSEGGVPIAGAGSGAMMAREEVHMLSLRRREEIRRQREEEDRRRQQEVVVRLTDIKVVAHLIMSLSLFVLSQHFVFHHNTHD